MVEVRSMFFFAVAVLAAVAPCAAGDAAPGFPAPSKETRPWTVCHVMGGRLDAEDLAREMDRWTAAGFGGARIVPIYGVEGEDAAAVPFMSAESVAMLSAAKALADEKNFGIDLSLGAGWCFGGRTVPKNLGIHALKVFKPGSKPPRGAKVLFERDGIRLAEYATGYAVKRTHRVDAGPMMNPFSPAAMRAHLTLFAPLSENASAKPRAAFHDSYEYAHAAWSDELPGIFAKYRGYRIEDHFAELAGLGDSDIVARVKCDWRETRQGNRFDFACARHEQRQGLVRWRGWTDGKARFGNRRKEGLFARQAAADGPFDAWRQGTLQLGLGMDRESGERRPEYPLPPRLRRYRVAPVPRRHATGLVAAFRQAVRDDGGR